jgi:hypothetical protein
MVMRKRQVALQSHHPRCDLDDMINFLTSTTSPLDWGADASLHLANAFWHLANALTDDATLRKSRAEVAVVVVVLETSPRIRGTKSLNLVDLVGHDS